MLYPFIMLEVPHGDDAAATATTIRSRDHFPGPVPRASGRPGQDAGPLARGADGAGHHQRDQTRSRHDPLLH